MSMSSTGSSSTSGLAITSLVLGIATLMFFWIPIFDLVPGALAVLLGVLGLKQVRRGTAAGKGLAVAGILCASLGMIPSFLLAGGIVVALLFGTPTISVERSSPPSAAISSEGPRIVDADRAAADGAREVAPSVKTTSNDQDQTDATSDPDRGKQP